jgi:IclR family transcriptional regulator, KDG regulon repressor
MLDRSVKSAERTLALLELFAQRECGLSVGEVSHALSIPIASASMLLRSLMRLGYLEYNRVTRLYTPTIRVMLFDSWSGSGFAGTGSITSRLWAIQKKCEGERVFVTIQNGAAMQHVLMLADGKRMACGEARPMTSTASGRILLSLKPDHEIVSWVRRSIAESRDSHIQMNDFLTLIRRVRIQGYAVNKGETEPRLGAVAVALPSAMGEGSMPVAIGVAGPLTTVLDRQTFLIGELNKFRRAFISDACGGIGTKILQM